MPNFKLKQTSEQVQKAIDNALYPDKELTKEGVPADSKSVGIEIKKNSIHIGTEAPTNGETVWIDTDEEPEENGGGSGGTSIDVTAEVGQTIVVKEIDANGKPTKWESADYQPRTHWMEDGDVVVVSEQSPEIDPELGARLVSRELALVNGTLYKVNWNGTTYARTAYSVDGTGVCIGNLGIVGGDDTGEPFLIGDSAIGMMIITADEQVAVSVTTKGEIVHKIPAKFGYHYILPLVLDDTTIAELYENPNYVFSGGTNIPNSCLDTLWYGGSVALKLMDTSTEDFILLSVCAFNYAGGNITILAHAVYTNGEIFVQLGSQSGWIPPID